MNTAIDKFMLFSAKTVAFFVIAFICLGVYLQIQKTSEPPAKITIVEEEQLRRWNPDGRIVQKGYAYQVCVNHRWVYYNADGSVTNNPSTVCWK